MRFFLLSIIGIFAIDIFSLIFGTVYLIAFFGVFKGEKWGSILAVVVASIDIIISAFTQGILLETIGVSGLFGALAVDAGLILLGLREYKQVPNKKK